VLGKGSEELGEHRADTEEKGGTGLTDGNTENPKASAKEGEPNEPKTPRSGKRRTLLIIAAAVVVIVAVLGVGGWKWHEQPSFCNAFCHTPMDTYVENYYQGDGLARIHAEAHVACLDCHEPKLSEQTSELVKWVSGDVATPLVQRKFGNEMCTKCHGGFDELAKKTADLKRNPHENPHSDDSECSLCHKSHAEQVDYCGQCHDNGGQKMITYSSK
jgi:hypothetical protein